MPLRNTRTLLFFSTLFLVIFAAACGSGGGGTNLPVEPTFTSTPVTAADEGALYTYQLSATVSDGSAITFSLSQAPAGATISGGTVSWTPTHDQARAANQFSATATTAKGGSATQSWAVTPAGILTISSVITYWTPAGTLMQNRVYPADLPYPAALVPQSDGSLARLQGAAKADGTFKIPHVPAGFYWLQLSPVENFWTSTTAFDAGTDVAGTPLATTTQSTTTFDISLSGADPIQNGDFFSARTNLQNVSLPTGFFTSFGGATYTSNVSVTTNIDFSQINTLYFGQYEPAASGGFTGTALGPALTQSSVTITNGAVNDLGGMLVPSPAASVPISIQGSAWANEFQTVAPSAPTPLLTFYSVGVQPFVQNGAVVAPGRAFRSNFSLLAPSGTLGGTGFVLPGLLAGSICNEFSGPNLFPNNFGFSPILTDQDFGTLSYGDPYPASWQREFEICQHSTVQIPRPNSTAVDTFLLTAGQITGLPSSPVAPLVGPVGAPMLNGASLFQPAALNTTTLKLSWNAPTGATPYGYYVTLFQLGTLPTGSVGYISAGRVGTSQTSLTIPFISAGTTYVIMISAEVNAAASMEIAPFRSRLPIGYATVISAPITVNPGAVATP
jgi:hypothetical protein